MADRSWTPSVGLVSGLSIAQTMLWGLTATLGVRSTIDSSTGPLLARPSDALAWLLVALLYGGLGLLGGLTGLALSLHAHRGGRTVKRRSAQRGWWANIAGAVLQLVVWIASFLAIGSVHGR